MTLHPAMHGPDLPGPSSKARHARFLLLPLLLCLLLFAAWPGRLQAEVAVPPLKAAVTDLTGTLTAQQSADLDARLKAWAQQKGSQVAVLIVPTTKPETIEQFSIRVAEAWKIGRKGSDDGVIVVVAKEDRSVRVEVGYGLEGAIPDAIARRIVEEIIVPRFRGGDFYGGLSEGVTSIIKLVEGEKLPAPASPLNRPGSGIDLQMVMGLLVMLVVINGMLGKIFGRILGSALGSGGAGVLVWLLLGSMAGGILVAVIGFIMSAVMGGSRGYLPIGMGHGGRGGWGGGGFGGGGFGGGGGGFGGGGASGRW
jgi:uncharacterized protein